MKKTDSRTFVFICEIPMFLGLLIIAAIIAIGVVGSQTAGITVIGEPISDSFVEWVEENIPLKSSGGRVRWSGTLVFFDPLNPEKDPLGIVDEATAYAHRDGTISHIEVKRVLLSKSLTEDLAKVIIKKEISGAYVVFDWWFDNQNYISLHDPEFNTFIDGMAANTVADELLSYGYSVVRWDGRTPPTCEHLLAVQELWQKNLIHKNLLVNGSGIQNLLLREGCID